MHRFFSIAAIVLIASIIGVLLSGDMVDLSASALTAIAGAAMCAFLVGGALPRKSSIQNLLSTMLIWLAICSGFALLYLIWF